jgi:hypothetical protein
VVNDDEECSKPVELAEVQHRLFCGCRAISPVFRKGSLALPIWEQASQREPILGEHRRWRMSRHILPQNDAPHRPANVPQPEMASVSNKSGKYTLVEDQHAA